MARTVIPFGPQHPVLPEPIHLTLTVEDEVITRAVPSLGYVHRGLEKLAEVRDFYQLIQVCERVCGICSMQHAMCYCQAVEELMAVEVPPRARFLRVIWAELHRVHSHLLWLGLFADALGFENLFMQLWRVRERCLDILEATTGNRVIVSVNVIGGVCRDLDPDRARWILEQCGWMETEIKGLFGPLFKDFTVNRRTRGKGLLTAEQALESGACGPTLRGSGVARDVRLEGCAAYGELDFEPVSEPDGDCRARAMVRYRETLQAMDLVRRALARLPKGEIAAKVKGRPEGEVVSRVEQPRGECLYYLKANGTENLDRLRIRTPTFANIPALMAMLPGLELADAAMVVLSIDPCISCTER